VKVADTASVFGPRPSAAPSPVPSPVPTADKQTTARRPEAALKLNFLMTCSFLQGVAGDRVTLRDHRLDNIGQVAYFATTDGVVAGNGPPR
jgi:hypothetical protein